MSEKQVQLALRRGALLTRIGMQRVALQGHAQGVKSLLDKADVLSRGVSWIKAHPGAVGAAVTLAVLLRPHRVLPWGRRAFLLWRGWLALRKKLAGVR
ncbi:MAG: YqjK-like family protein [Azonexus sp.]|nr:YqjK-like family protein [Azonexus sp.]